MSRRACSGDAGDAVLGYPSDTWASASPQDALGPPRGRREQLVTLLGQPLAPSARREWTPGSDPRMSRISCSSTSVRDVKGSREPPPSTSSSWSSDDRMSQRLHDNRDART